jgi:heme/copper-type cytochrome/quinol oxidase subunit 2
MKDLIKQFLQGLIFTFWTVIVISIIVIGYTICLCKYYDNQVKIEQLKHK